MNKPQFYICIDSFWQNSPDRYVGPFDSRKAANAEVDRAMSADGSKVTHHSYVQDIGDSVRVCGVMSRTEALRRSLVDDNPFLGGNVIGAEIPLTLAEMKGIEEEWAEMG